MSGHPPEPDPVDAIRFRGADAGPPSVQDELSGATLHDSGPALPSDFVDLVVDSRPDTVCGAEEEDKASIASGEDNPVPSSHKNAGDQSSKPIRLPQRGIHCSTWRVSIFATWAPQESQHGSSTATENQYVLQNSHTFATADLCNSLPRPASAPANLCCLETDSVSALDNLQSLQPEYASATDPLSSSQNGPGSATANQPDSACSPANLGSTSAVANLRISQLRYVSSPTVFGSSENGPVSASTNLCGLQLRSVSSPAVPGGSENGPLSATVNLCGSKHSCEPHRLAAPETAGSSEVAAGASQATFPGFSLTDFLAGPSSHDNRKIKGTMFDTAADRSSELEQRLPEVASNFQDGQSNYVNTNASNATNVCVLDAVSDQDSELGPALNKDSTHGENRPLVVTSDFQGDLSSYDTNNSNSLVLDSVLAKCSESSECDEHKHSAAASDLQDGLTDHRNIRASCSALHTATDKCDQFSEERQSEVPFDFQDELPCHRTTESNKSVNDVATTRDKKNCELKLPVVVSDFQDAVSSHETSCNKSSELDISDQDGRLDDHGLPSESDHAHWCDENKGPVIASANYSWSDNRLFEKGQPPVQESTASSAENLLENTLSSLESNKEELLDHADSPNPAAAQFVYSDNSHMRWNLPPVQEASVNAHGGDFHEEAACHHSDEEREEEADEDNHGRPADHAERHYYDGEIVDLRQERLQRICLRCHLQNREVTLLPCGHIVVCYGCFLALCNHHQGLTWRCLICNQNFVAIHIPRAVHNREVRRMLSRRRFARG